MAFERMPLKSFLCQHFQSMTKEKMMDHYKNSSGAMSHANLPRNVFCPFIFHKFTIFILEAIEHEVIKQNFKSFMHLQG